MATEPFGKAGHLSDKFSQVSKAQYLVAYLLVLSDMMTDTYYQRLYYRIPGMKIQGHALVVVGFLCQTKSSYSQFTTRHAENYPD